jgi:ankyrin repeat protein
MIGLHLAAYFGMREAMIALFKSGHELNAKDSYGRAPLSWAAENGHEAVAKPLLAIDSVDPDSKDNGGRTSLLWAAENGHAVVIKLLLARKDVNPDAENNNGWTPLSRAARNGREMVVKLLPARDSINPGDIQRSDTFCWRH